MDKNSIEYHARIYALQNAIQFDGKATSKAVIGKVIAATKKHDIPPKKIVPIVNKTIAEINALTQDQQVTQLKKLAPELLHKEKKERDFSLPDLPHATQGHVVTRFPPEPNGYLHIGHAKAAIIDYEYARKYDGKFILRFDDTNPENVQADFYDAQKKDLTWLNIEWDDEYNTSDNLETHYQLAEQLIQQHDAYICSCPPETIKKGRFTGTACSCRKRTPDENHALWKDMCSQNVDHGYILRLRANLISENTAMRDPTLFRIITKPHPLHGDKYTVWPTYDFAGAIEDSIGNITHPFRTKEYELRDECYFYILERLHLRKPHLMEFSRLSIEGMPVSKRKIKPLIDKQLVQGYDDIRLPTLRGLKKRGILSDSIKQFVLTQGISKVESSVTFSQVEAINRKLLDPITKRYYFTAHPLSLIVENAPLKTITLQLHPTHNLGTRQLKTSSQFYISKTDAQTLQKGETLRLKDLYNITILEKTSKHITAKYIGDTRIPDTKKIQWVTSDHIPMNVFIPHSLFKNDEYNPDSLEKVPGYAESNLDEIKDGEIIQFERFGFVRIEKQANTIAGYFTHK